MKRIRFRTTLITIALLVALISAVAAQQAARDFSRESARTAPEWVRDGIIYQIFPRNFSQEGNFNAITAQLDRLNDLGATILWLMPIHPIGQEKKKGTI